jgi:hypothetical protein
VHAQGGLHFGSTAPWSSATLFQRLLWTFAAETFAALWTFRPGTFSGIGRTTGSLILETWIAPDTGLTWLAPDEGLLWTAVDLGLVWKANDQMPIAGLLSKEVVDNRVYSFDWSNIAEIRGGEQIVSATITPDLGGLTIGLPVIVQSLHLVTARISGGTLGSTYNLECIIQTSGGDTISTIGQMVITI